MGLIKGKKEQFVTKLKNAIKIRNITQRELAKETGIVQPTISTYHSGKNIPNEKNLKKIINALDIDESYFEGIYEFSDKQDKVEKEDTVVFDEKDRQDIHIEHKDTTEIIRISRELGALRYALIQNVEKDREQVKYYNEKEWKLYEIMIHELEFIETMTDEDILRIVRKHIYQLKQMAESRRIAKDRMYLVQELLNSMAIKNPNAFVVKAINGKGDILKTMEELKKDVSLYVKK